MHSRLAFLSRLFRSRYQLEYSQAQDILDGRPPKPGHEVAAADRPALRRNLALLASLAEHRRRLRLEVGGRMWVRGMRMCTARLLTAACRGLVLTPLMPVDWCARELCMRV